MGSITAANAVLTLTIPGIFPAPQQLQGFATDDIYDIPAIASVETMMGVDGVLSGGFVYVKIPQEVTLQADSASNAVFDTWWTQMQAAQDVYIANGLIRLKSIGTKFVQSTGYLTSYKPAPAGKKILQPRRYEITWETVMPQAA
jgi:Tail fiber protein gp32